MNQLGYAVAALVAAEATGVTNLSERATGGATTVQIEAPERPQVPTVGDGGPSDAVLAALAQRGDSGPSAADIAAAVNSGTGGGSGGSTTETVINLVEETKDKTQETTETVTETVTGGDDGRDGGGGSGGTRGGDGGATTDGDDSYDIQTDYTGPGREIIRGGAETLQEGGDAVKETVGGGGDVVNGIVDFSGKTGETVREAGNLLLTGEADTSNTHARDRGRVGIDFSGDGSPGGKLSERLGGLL